MNFVKLFEIHQLMKIVPVSVKLVLIPLFTDPSLVGRLNYKNNAYRVYLVAVLSSYGYGKKLDGEGERILSCCLLGNLFFCLLLIRL